MADKPQRPKPAGPGGGADSTVRLRKGSVQRAGETRRRLVGVVVAALLLLAAAVVVWQTLRSADRVGSTKGAPSSRRASCNPSPSGERAWVRGLVFPSPLRGEA